MKGFMPFVMLGDPDKETSLEIVKALIDTGASCLELGFPFSDPMLDGHVIQQSHKRAMMPVDDCFDLIKKIRNYSKIPISLMVSYNIVYQRPINKFYSDAKDAGVQFVLIPDLPLEESSEVFGEAAKSGIAQVPLISPDTPEDRIKEIGKRFGGYIYLVSLLGTTGERESANSKLAELISKVKRNINLPVFVGFGVSNPKAASLAISSRADGVISGTPFCKIIGENLSDRGAMLGKIKSFAEAMVKASKGL